jgi:hypothetical protein
MRRALHRSKAIFCLHPRDGTGGVATVSFGKNQE